MSNALTIPTTRELESFTPRDRWQLEAALDTALDEIRPKLRELNDAELRFWVEVEGKTQREIADLVGISQPAISKRCTRLGIKAQDNRGGDRTFDNPVIKDDPIPGETVHTPEGYWDGEGDEVVDAEIVEDDPQQRPPTHSAANGPAYAGPEPDQSSTDPAARVRCPTCGHMVKPDDFKKGI